jgi:hypothetical protein
MMRKEYLGLVSSSAELPQMMVGVRERWMRRSLHVEPPADTFFHWLGRIPLGGAVRIKTHRERIAMTIEDQEIHPERPWHGTISPVANRWLEAMAALLLLAGLSAPPAAHADVVPANIAYTECSYPVNGFDTFVIDNPSTCSAANGPVKVSASLSTAPAVFLQANATGGGTAEASLTWYFRVNGPPGEQVPLLLFANLTASLTPTYDGFADASLSETGGPSVDVSYGGANSNAAAPYQVCDSPFSCTYYKTMPLVMHVIDFSDKPGTLSMGVFARLDGNVAAETASATADPYLEVDPSFPNASEYSIEFSPGVGNGIASVPEPNLLPQLALGILVTLSVLRYRRR